MKYFIIAGEASGDLHGSNLMHELKQKDAQADFMFLGGDLMQTQGGSLVKHYRKMAFMGVINVLLNIRTVLRNIDDCKKAIIDYQPDVIILIDYPGFNLRIAKFVKEKLDIPVYYYISPKLWAWKEYRIKSIKKYINKMFTILPFETEFYKKHQYEVEYVGNPSVDSVAYRNDKDETFERFIKKNNLNNQPIVALLAGSRKQEIKNCLPKMTSLASTYPNHQFVVAAAPGIELEYYKNITKNSSVKIVNDATYNLLQHSTAAIVNSGTATLETALFRVPQVVVYSLIGGYFGNIIKIFLLKIKYVSLVNLIAGHELAKELIGGYFNKQNLKKELDKVLFNENHREHVLNEYDKIIQLLGKPGAAKHTAEKIFNYIH